MAGSRNQGANMSIGTVDQGPVSDMARDAPDGEKADLARPKAILKIYLGMAPGVGKSLAMLAAARLLGESGLDVVIGWVDAHGQGDTESQAEGIESIAPRIVAYGGSHVREMDLDAIIARRPAIVLIDDLAHPNAAGLRHARRYQDILELLEAGISVHTTVNIQHLESLADSIELLTLVPIRDRVPDSIFDRADELQLIDMSPTDLLVRLRQGKVHTGAVSGDFFKPDNLLVLREITLRYAAQLASHRVLEFMRETPGMPGTPESGRILVAVGPSPHGENLLRWTRRLAYALRADWECLNIETGRGMSETELARLSRNLELARSLGAKVTSVTNLDVASGILGHAHDSNASFLVIGKSGLSRRRPFVGSRTISEAIMRDSGPIPVFAVQDRGIREKAGKSLARKVEASPPAQFLVSIAAIAAVTLLNLLIAGYVGYWGAAIPYLAAISILALFLGRGPVFLAAFASAALWDFVFISPRFDFFISDPADLLMLGLYFLVALTSGWFTQKLKSSERVLRSRERRLEALSSLAMELAGVGDRSAILEVGSLALKHFFDAEIAIFMREASGKLETETEGGWQAIDGQSLSAAGCCLETRRVAGRDTDTLPQVEWHFAPLQSVRGALGVVGLRIASDRRWTHELDAFLATMLRTIALAVERELAIVDSTAAALSRESARLGKLLLDSVSHELRTPLTIIQGSATALADDTTASNPRSRSLLIGEISMGASRLDAIVGNLLSINRLESGSLSLHLSEVDQEELVSAAVSQMKGEAGEALIEVVGTILPAVLVCDAALIVQVLVNLLRNAFRYGAPGGRISIRFGKEPEGFRTFDVEDQGRGVPEKDLDRIFGKFHRGPDAAPGGCGLGLAICKGIVEAHGGSIAARNLEGGGFLVGFRLPAFPEPHPILHETNPVDREALP